MTMWKTRQGFCTMTLYNRKRDVAQLGSAFVLGTKCHGFKSCHPYLLLLLWAVTRDQLRSIQIGQNSEFHFSICMRYKNHPFLYCFFSCRKKALLVQFGRTWVSKTQCRRFKSYRAWFCSCYVESKKKEQHKVECPTTVLNPNQRKQQKYSTWRGDHWPISVHFPLPFLYGYASFRGPYSNNSLIDQLEERNPSWIALPCLKRFMKNRPWNSCFEEAMNIVFFHSQ